jgi:hypothetical protein
MRTRAILGLVATAMAATAVSSAAPLKKPYVRTCASSVYGDLGARWRQKAVQAGPVTFIGALERRDGLVARKRASGHKLLIVVEPRHTVTISIDGRARRFASLLYDPAKFHLRYPRVRDGAEAVTFVACFSPHGSAPWERGTQFNGEFVVFGPRCVPVEISGAPQSQPIRRSLSFGAGECREQRG